MMLFNENEFAGDRDSQQQTKAIKPNAYRADDGEGIEEKDIERHFLFGKGDNPANPTEGKGIGGQSFGQENNTPAANDKNNPSQMAGDTNAYLGRKEPSEEHPEDENFTAPQQDGLPEYSKAQNNTAMENPKPEKVERGNRENDRPHEQEPYREGTADNDGNSKPNIPGPNEVPDQQKVGEGDDKDHIET